MKGFFNDCDKYTMVVWGDWRGKDGKVIKYRPPSDEEIHVSGGIGFYYYLKGKFKRAVYFWQQDILVINRIQKEENKRFHKGWFFYMLSLAYANLKNDEKSKYWMDLAREEDKISYGDKAKDFPSNKIKEHVSSNDSNQ